MTLASTLTIGAALLAVLLLAWGAGRLARALDLVSTRARRASGGRLTIRTSLPLDARRRLYLLACDDREALFMAGPGGDTFLGWTSVTAPREGFGP